MEGEDIPYKMLSQDAYSRWLGIEILECEIGRCKVEMTIRKDMLNSMNKAHGGISYSLADTAFGFAANTYGKYAVSIETSINHIEALEEGDYLCLLDNSNIKELLKDLNLISYELLTLMGSRLIRDYK